MTGRLPRRTPYRLPRGPLHRVGRFAAVLVVTVAATALVTARLSGGEETVEADLSWPISESPSTPAKGGAGASSNPSSKALEDEDGVRRLPDANIPEEVRGAKDTADTVYLSDGEETHRWAEKLRPLFPTDVATSPAFPELSTAAYAGTVAYAGEFTDQLLSIDYATDSYDDVMGWVGWELAAQPVPQSWAEVTADDMRVLALADLLGTSPADTFNGPGSLVASRREWDRLAAAGTTQTVTDMVILPEPKFEQMKADGSVESAGDPLLDCVLISATIERTQSVAIESRDVEIPFFCVGTATHHEGLALKGVGELRAAP